MTDIKRTGEWSPICKECWWKEPATGPAVGARFHGRNDADGQVWESESEVVAAEDPVEFTWMVDGNTVRRSDTLTPEGDGTSSTESWAVQPAAFDMFAEHFGDNAQSQLEVRREAALSGIPATLKAIKEVVERGSA